MHKQTHGSSKTKRHEHDKCIRNVSHAASSLTPYLSVDPNGNGIRAAVHVTSRLRMTSHAKPPVIPKHVYSEVFRSSENKPGEINFVKKVLA